MKTFIESLRDRSPEELSNEIARDSSKIKIMQRDIEAMKQVLAEKEKKP